MCAHLSPELHPIDHRYRRGELIVVLHMLEDLYGEWFEEVHVQPLLAYFQCGLRLMQREDGERPTSAG